MENNPNETFQKKYSHLEVSILSLSEVEKDNATKRIDSEFFKKEYLENEKLIHKKNKIKDFLDFNIKNIKSIYLNKNFNYLQISDIDLNNGLEYSTTQIDHKNIPDRASYILRNNDICISTVRPNRNAIALIQNPKRLVGTSGFAILRIKDKKILPEFLFIFCKTNFFITKMMRANSASLYPAVSDSDIFKCQIYIPSLTFQKEIAQMVKASHLYLQQSKSLYKEAENIFYTELGLDPENPLKSILEYEPAPNVSIHSLKESFLKTGRLDSEYYQLKYDLMEEKLKSKGFTTLRDICSLINYGSVPTSPYSEDDKGIPYIKGLNLKNLQVDENKLDKITNTQDLNEKFFTRENDIIISQMGTVGDCGLVAKHQENYIFASFTIRIRLKNIQEFNPYFIALYIQNLSKEWYLYRNIAQASVRQNTDLPTINNLYIPLVDIKIQNQIAHHIQKSFDLRKEAKDLLQKAKEKVENAINEGGGGIITLVKLKLKLAQIQYRTALWIMYEYLGIFDAKKPLSNPINTTIKTLKDSFFKTGRLDSEYYQAKYDLIEKRIKDYKNGYIKLQEIDIKDRNFTLEDERHYNYIELSNINNNGNISNPTRDIGKNLPSRAKRLVKTGDILISSVEGCLSSCAFITEEFNNYVVSNGFYILKTPYINGETLLILFKSSLFQEYLRKFPTGTILTAISKDELQNILIPKIDPNIQTEIAQNIQKSFELRTQSKALLQEAKEKVELAISKGGGGQLEGKL